MFFPVLFIPGGIIPELPDPIARVPLRGRFRLIRESFVHTSPEKGETCRYRDILFFIQYLLPLKWVIIASFLVSSANSVLGTVLPLSTKWIIDYIFLNESISPVLHSLSIHHLEFLTPAASAILTSLPLLIGILALVSICRYLLGSELSLINYRITTEYSYRVKMAVFSRVLQYPISYFRSTRSGYLLARINADVSGISGISGWFLQGVITSGISLIVSALVLSSLSVPLTIFVIMTVPVPVTISYVILRFQRSHTLRIRESGLQMAADGQEIIGTIDLIKTHASERRELQRFMKRNLDNISLNIASLIFGQVTGGIVQACTSMIRLAVMLFGGSQVLSGQMSIGSYTAFLAMYPQMSGAISSLLQVPLTLQGTAVSAGRVKELLNMPTEYEHDDPEKSLLFPNCRASGHIRVEGISFEYSPDCPVLTDVSLEIRPGSHIALTGQTGAGKTTFINLLLKLYLPKKGKISIDGFDYADLNPEWIRNQIATVSQDLILFHETIMDNIRYSRPEADEREVIDAARAAGIHDDIMQLPNGYNTIAGEQGKRLSGGQKQRIAIARALLRDAPIMILDEPTSHLDHLTEDRIIRELLEKTRDRTMIVITHRESLLRLVDTVYLVEKGGIRKKQNH